MRLDRFRLLSVTMLFLFIMNLVVTSVKSEDYTATIYADPECVFDGTMGIGSTFEVAFKIRDAVNCYSWELNVSWDPTVLTIIGLTYGDFLVGQPEGSTWFMDFNDLDLGWGMIGEQTNYWYDGVDGDGWLLNYTFEVLSDFGHSVLNVEDLGTFLMVYPPLPLKKELVLRENGYFSNIGGDTDRDGDIDYDDFIVLAGAYGTSSGNPAYDETADFDRDGDVDYDDFIMLAGNYGTSV